MSFEVAAGEFERLVILNNPVSTQAQRPYVQRQLSKLTTAYPNHLLLETSGDEMADIDKLLAQLEAGDILGAAGGDKTVGLAACALEQSNLEVPLAPFGTGNANDFSRSLNGKLRHTSMLDIVRKGQPVPVRPIHGTILDSAGVSINREAINCAGVGGGADISHALNLAPYRQHNKKIGPVRRTIAEGRLVMEAARNLKTFEIVNPYHPTEPQVRVEESLANSTRLGRYGRPPVRAEHDMLYKISLGSRSPGPVIGLLGRLMTGTCPQNVEDYLIAPARHSFQLGKTEGVMAYFDGDVVTDRTGEPIRYTEGAFFSFAQGQPVQILRTRQPKVRLSIDFETGDGSRFA